MQNKNYRLLKDLPFAKAGDILSLERSQEYGYFKLCKDRSNPRSIELYEGIVEGFIDNFDEWFGEIEEPEEYFIINFLHLKITKISTDFFAEWVIENLKSLGLLFKTEEQAEKHLVYLQAKEVIKQDAEGFKPDWDDEDEPKYMGRYSCISGKTVFDWYQTYHNAYGTIFFKTTGDIKESFEKHPDEWKIYLTYER